MRRPFSLLALACLALTPALAPAAHADAGDIELSLTSEAVAFFSDSVSATSNDGLAFTPSLRAGWSPVDRLTVLAGWRSLLGLARGGRGYELTTSGDAIIAGARYALGLHPIFDVSFELELEALHADFALDVAGRHGETSAWAFGAAPKVAASARSTLGPFTFDFRLFGGFALRSDLHAAGLRLASQAPRRQVAPLDLGRVNLSGVVFGANFAVIF